MEELKKQIIANIESINEQNKLEFLNVFVNEMINDKTTDKQ